MATIPPPKTKRPSGARALRVEELGAALEGAEWDAQAVLDALVGALAKGQPHPELWSGLLAASVQHDKVGDVAFAFEHAVSERRVKLIAPPLQAELFLHAARFFAETLGDDDGARAHAQRALAAAPGHPRALALLRTLLADRGDRDGLVRLELAAAEAASGDERLERLRRAVELSGDGAAAELAVEAMTRLHALAPSSDTRAALEVRLAAAGRHGELAALLEAALRAGAPPEPEEARALAERVLALRMGPAADAARAIEPVEALLALEPSHAGAIEAAEKLLEHAAVAPRAAAAMSEAYERTGRVGNAAAMLGLELKLARGPRRVEVQRRLAVLRQDALDDPEGAYELLGPAVAGAPADDELRRRFVQLAASLGKTADAAQLLSRALASTRDPALRARVAVDAGRAYEQAGDARRAQQSFQQALEAGDEPAAQLEAARGLAELHAEAGQMRPLMVALEHVLRLEPEAERRHAAARRLARLSESEGDAAKGVSAWRALVDSPWADEALRRLEALHEAAADRAGLAETLGLRAERSRDAAEARPLAERAAELWAEVGARDRAIEAWRGVARRFGASPELDARLAPLLEAEKRWGELAELVERQASAVEGVERVGYLLRLAQLRQLRLSDAPGAVAALGAALALAPEERSVRSALEKAMASGEARLAAAVALGPVLRREGATAKLVQALEVEGLLAGEAARRLAALDEAARLAGEALGDRERATALAGRALGLAVADAPERVDACLARVDALADGLDPSVRARALSLALGDAPVDRPEIARLARAAGEALAQVGEVPRAVAILRRLLAQAPDDAVLLGRIDELLAERGSPRERLALYESALAQPTEPMRRRQLLHAVAALQRRDLGNARAARAAYQLILEEDPRDLAAHSALVELLTEQGDRAALSQELERALGVADGERRLHVLERLAAVEVESGRREAALVLQRELLAAGVGHDDFLASVESVARSLGEVELLRQVLAQRVERAADSAARAAALEALAEAWRLEPASVHHAVAALRAAAVLAETDLEDSERALAAWRRAFELAPTEDAIAAHLVTVAASRLALAELEAPVALLTGTRVVEARRALVTAALRVAAPDDVARFEHLATQALASAEPTARRELEAALAGVLARDPARAAAAVGLHRRLVESAGDGEPAALDAYEAFLRGAPGLDGATGERRWVHERRASRGEATASALLEWARAEESELGEPSRALALYERILSREPEHVEALREAARLKARLGDAVGAVELLRALREGVDAAARAGVDTQIAELLLDSLGQPQAALGVVASVLEAQPADDDALALALRALAHPSARDRAAELLERAARDQPDPASRARVLERLLALGPEPTLAAARGRWYAALVECSAEDDERALEVALRGVHELPAAEELWDALEATARRLGRPEPAAAAYDAALGGGLSADEAEAIGRRVVDFHEEWFDDGERVLELLRRVLGLNPSAAWAFDRLKLAYGSSGRWDDLFALYDAALARLEPAERAELLREAAMAAKDFASDASRAIGYYEALAALAPADARVEQALERLYEREGRTRPLVAILTRRATSAAPAERHALEVRIATLWLDDGEVLEAFGIAESLIAGGSLSADAVALLERLIAAPTARRSVPPPSATRPAAPRERSVRDLVAQQLAAHYTERGRHADVVRMLAIELEGAADDAARAVTLARIADLCEHELGDAAQAFDAVLALVRLGPGDLAVRDRLGRLAATANREGARAEALEALAEQAEGDACAGLLLEAAGVLTSALGDAPRGAAQLERALAVAATPELALRAAREADPLLAAEGAAERRCAALERRAELEPEPADRVECLAVAAELALGALAQPERAAADWRRALALAPVERRALDGLCSALDAARDWRALVAALVERARHLEGRAARADRVRAARLLAVEVGSAEQAIEAWERVRALDGADAESFEELAALLGQVGRDEELARLLEAEAASEAGVARRRELLLRLARVHVERTADARRAVRAYLEAADWDGAIAVAGSTHADPELAVQVTRALLDRSGAAWVEDGSPEPARAAAWAVEELSALLLDRGRHDELVELLLDASRLPFDARRRRELRRDAALLTVDRLGDPERASSLLLELFGETAADPVAQSFVGRLVTLLEDREEHGRVVELWERQAAELADAGEAAAAAAAWSRAANAAEGRLADAERALADHGRAADLGHEGSLEALARIHATAGRDRDAARALERLCTVSSREELGERALRLAATLIRLGDRASARKRLEHAAHAALDGAAVRRRLAELYREDGAWPLLADLLVAEAARAPDAATRLRWLEEAAELRWSRGGDAAGAVPLLEQAIELAPDDVELRLRLAAALRAVGGLERASEVLRAQIDRYGARRPKERALVHRELALVRLGQGAAEAAVAELELATKIDPAHPGVLGTLARVAFDLGDLDRAERTYRALLLLLRRDDPRGPTRAEALLDLSEIAVHRDDSLRATEFVESAFEAALESERDAAALEAALRSRGRVELLARAVEARLAAASGAAAQARALADLVALHGESLSAAPERRSALSARAERILAGLDADPGADDSAWSSIARAFDALGESARESEILEKRIAAWRLGRASAPEAPVLYRLAEVRLAEAETRSDGLDLLARAFEAQPDASRAAGALREVLRVDAERAEAIELFERLARASGSGALLAEALALRAERSPEPALVRECVALAAEESAPALARRALEALVRHAAELPDADALWALEELAGRLHAAGDFARALELRLLRAERLDLPASRDELEAVARAAVVAGEPRLEARALDRLLARDPADRDVWERLLRTLRQLGDDLELARLIDRVLPFVDSAADRSRLRLEQATLLLEQPEGRDAAAAVLEDILGEDPRQVGAAVLLERLLAEAGRQEDLAALLRQQLDAARDAEDSARVVALAGRLAALLEALDRAEDALDVLAGALDWGREPALLATAVRLAEATGDDVRLGDALEASIAVAEPAVAEALALRLVDLRRAREDDAGLERALELGLNACPSSAVLRDEVLRRHAERGDWGRVADVLEQALEAEPGDPGLVDRAVDARRASGDSGRALAVVESAIAREPRVPWLVRRAELLGDVGRGREAVAAWIELEARGEAVEEELVTALDVALEQAHGEDLAVLGLEHARRLVRRGDVERARDRLDAVIAVAPAWAEAHELQAEVGERVQDWAAVLGARRALVDLATGPEVVEQALAAAGAAVALGEPAAAIPALERAHALAPGRPELVARMRAIYEPAGARRELARLLLADAVTGGAPAESLGQLVEGAEVLLELDDGAEEAVPLLERARSGAPEHVELGVLLARGYARSGRVAEARAILAELAETQRGRRVKALAPVFREQARLHLAGGDAASALAAMTRAFDMDLRNGALALELADIARRAGEDEAELKAWRSISMMKTSRDGAEGAPPEAKAEANYRLALAAHAEGDAKKARVLAMKALSDVPDHAGARSLLG
ncbi:MAG: tetratricopeptide repeat protein [Polyangiaceae bacterium]|nr:tetratricopeptide repeat protein [Polyangiaceae bacterium]